MRAVFNMPPCFLEGVTTFLRRQRRSTGSAPHPYVWYVTFPLQNARHTRYTVQDQQPGVSTTKTGSLVLLCLRSCWASGAACLRVAPSTGSSGGGGSSRTAIMLAKSCQHMVASIADAATAAATAKVQPLPRFSWKPVGSSAAAAFQAQTVLQAAAGLRAHGSAGCMLHCSSCCRRSACSLWQPGAHNSCYLRVYCSAVEGS